MKAEDFLKSKNISKPTYEGVRLVDSGMKAYRIIDLLNEYAEIVRNEANGAEQGDINCNIPLVIKSLPLPVDMLNVLEKTYNRLLSEKPTKL